MLLNSRIPNSVTYRMEMMGMFLILPRTNIQRQFNNLLACGIISDFHQAVGPLKLSELVIGDKFTFNLQTLLSDITQCHFPL
jgi:type III secretory pathway component EscT